MAEPLSMDLRKRVVAAIKGGMSLRGAAAHFQVGVSSAIRWAAQVEKSGDLSPNPQGGDRRSAAIEAQANTILSLPAAAPDITLMELQAGLAEKGHRFSVSTIWRFFARRKITGSTALAKRAYDSAVASERLAVVTGDSPVGSGCETPTQPRNQR